MIDKHNVCKSGMFQVEIMEMSHDSGFSDSFADMMTMESPKAILKQRICDLEKINLHHKKQVSR
jgi:hypothetical protein